MEYAKKMALIEPRLLESLQQQQQQQSCHDHQPQGMLEEKLCQLDQAMQQILDRKDVSQEEKLKLYHQILQKYLLYKDKVEPMTVKVIGEPSVPEPYTIALPPPPAAEETQESLEAEIIQSAPKNLRHKASVLLRRLKQDDNIAWNTKGELVYKGDVIPNTHIHDLVQDVLRKRKTHVPVGWQTFARALRESNIPQDLVGNLDRWQWMNQEEQTPMGVTVSATEVHTPKIKSRSSKQLRWAPYK